MSETGNGETESIDKKDNCLKKFGFEEEKQVGGVVVRRKDSFFSSCNDRRGLNLFKYTWEEARREREIE